MSLRERRHQQRQQQQHFWFRHRFFSMASPWRHSAFRDSITMEVSQNGQSRAEYIERVTDYYFEHFASWTDLRLQTVHADYIPAMLLAHECLFPLGHARHFHSNNSGKPPRPRRERKVVAATTTPTTKTSAHAQLIPAAADGWDRRSGHIASSSTASTHVSAAEHGESEMGIACDLYSWSV